MRGNDKKLCFCEEESLDQLHGRITKEENDLGHNAKQDAVEGPLDCVTRD